MATLVGLQYLQNREQRRHNLVTEKQTDLARVSNEAIAEAQRNSQETIASKNRANEVAINEAKLKAESINRSLDRASNERIASNRDLTSIHIENMKQSGYDKDRASREKVTNIETGSKEAIAQATNQVNYLINAEKNATQKTISDNSLNIQNSIAYWERELRKQLNEANLDEAYLRDVLNFVGSMFNAIGRIIPG